MRAQRHDGEIGTWPLRTTLPPFETCLGDSSSCRSFRKPDCLGFGLLTAIAGAAMLRHCLKMETHVWKWPERRDLYLALRILAGETDDGDWLQWASDTLIQDLELYHDPTQGVRSWLAGDELDSARELGKCLWHIVGANPFSAAKRIGDSAALRSIASKLVELIEANGRDIG